MILRSPRCQGAGDHTHGSGMRSPTESLLDVAYKSGTSRALHGSLGRNLHVESAGPQTFGGKAIYHRRPKHPGKEHVQLVEVSKHISLSIGLMNGMQICPKTWPLGGGSRFVGPISPVSRRGPTHAGRMGASSAVRTREGRERRVGRSGAHDSP